LGGAYEPVEEAVDFRQHLSSIAVSAAIPNLKLTCDPGLPARLSLPVVPLNIVLQHALQHAASQGEEFNQS
jgi:hypothetical protein